MNKQIIDNIKKLLIDLSTEFDNFRSQASVFANRIVVSVTEQQSNNNEKLKDLKLDLLDCELTVCIDKLIISIKNLSYFNNYLSNNELKQFVKKLIGFNKKYIELDEIWKTIDWKYYYDIFNNNLLIYSKKPSILTSFPISDVKSITETINGFLTSKSRNDFEKMIIKEIKSINIELQSLIKHLDFVDLFADLHKEITNSLSKSLEIQWNEIISKSVFSKSDIVILAFVLRLSIENQLKNHPIILADTSSIKMLGKIFKKLQSNGIYVSEKNDIQRYKKPLDEIVHGEKETITRTELIEIKEYFKSILAIQHLNLF